MAGLAPIEGYLVDLWSQLSKVPAVVLVVIWLVTRVRQGRRPHLHPAHVALAGVAVAVLLSTTVHRAEDPYALEYVVRWLPFLTVAAVLIDVVGREATAKAVLGSLSAGALVAAGGAIYSVLFDGNERATGPLQDPNDLACVLVAALPLLLVLVPTRKSRQFFAVRALLLVCACLLVGGAAMTLSRGGGFALCAVIVIVIVRRVVSTRIVIIAAVLLGAAGALLLVVAPDQVQTALGQKAYIASTNIDTRELRWQAAARMVAENPLLGVGPGGFRAEYAAASHVAELTEQTPVAHSMYLEVAAELGLPGFVCFAGFVAIGLVASERALRTGADRRTVVAIQASIFAVLIASLFLSEEYYLPVWALTACACGLQLQYSKSSRTS